MNHIRAIGFDLFNTLVIAEPHTLDEAMRRLVSSLRQSGFVLEMNHLKRATEKLSCSLLKKPERMGGRHTTAFGSALH